MEFLLVSYTSMIIQQIGSKVNVLGYVSFILDV